VSRNAEQRRRDLALRQNPRGNLIQQRLEQMVLGPRDHRHLDWRMLERLGCREATETRANDDNAMPPAFLARAAHAALPYGC